MAKRGRKPKPHGLRLRDGNRSHLPMVPDPLMAIQPDIGNLDPPIKLDGRRKQIWDQYIRRLPWLTWADVHAALAWVILAEGLENGTLKRTEHVSLRVHSNLLGLNPGARAERAAKQGELKSVSKLSTLIGKDAA